MECPNHGVKQAEVSWAEPGSRSTQSFERFAIDVSQGTDTQEPAGFCGSVGTGPGGVQGRAVLRRRALEPPPDSRMSRRSWAQRALP